MQRIKSYSNFTVRQTDTQTERRTFCIPICTGEIFFYMEIYTFQYTSFVKDYTTRWTNQSSTNLPITNILKSYCYLRHQGANT